MRFSVLFLSLIVGGLSGAFPAQAKSEAQSQTATSPASIEAVNTDFYDETTYDWPGNSRTGKPSVTEVVANPGLAVSPVTPFGDCVFIDNMSRDGKVFTLSLTTLEKWSEFKATPPDFLTVTECCLRMKVSNPCGTSQKTIAPDRIGAIRTLAFGPNYDRIYRCLPGNSATTVVGQWTPIGEMNEGGCTGQP
jgi:hypothetical protein